MFNRNSIQLTSILIFKLIKLLKSKFYLNTEKIARYFVGTHFLFLVKIFIKTKYIIFPKIYTKKK